MTEQELLDGHWAAVLASLLLWVIGPAIAVNGRPRASSN